MEVISFELKSSFAFFNMRDNKEHNDTYQCIHPPCVLGILGSIIGLKGYKDFNGKLEYLEALRGVKINIEILNKTLDTTRVRFSDTTKVLMKKAALFSENCLVSPHYRIRILLDDSEASKKLKIFLLSGKSVFNQYLGRAEFFTAPEKVKIELMKESGEAKNFRGIHLKEDSKYLKNERAMKIDNVFSTNPFFVIPTSIGYDKDAGVLYNRFDEVSFDGPYIKSSGTVLFKESEAYYFFDVK